MAGHCSFISIYCTWKQSSSLNSRLIISVGTYLFYVCIVIYLYGDLAIYATAVPKTLRDVAW